MNNINAGDLRHQVTLMRDTSAPAGGQRTPNYVAIGTYYALVECLGGAEVVNATQRKGLLNYRVTLRASSGPIRPTDQLAWNGHTLNVSDAAVDPFGIMQVVNAVEYPSTAQ